MTFTAEEIKERKRIHARGLSKIYVAVEHEAQRLQGLIKSVRDGDVDQEELEMSVGYLNHNVSDLGDILGLLVVPQ